MTRRAPVHYVVDYIHVYGYKHMNSYTLTHQSTSSVSTTTLFNFSFVRQTASMLAQQLQHG